MNRKNLGKLLFLPFIASAMFLTSCDEENGVVVNIPLAYTDIYLEVDPTPVAGTSTLDSIVVDNSDLDSILAAQNATRDDIQSIKLAEVKFTIVDSATHLPNTDNFNKLNASSLFIKTSSLGEREVASKDTIPQGVNPLALDVDDATDLAPYIKSTQFIIRAAGSTNAPITQKMFIKVNIKFNVAAEI
jgi:hypothetical protein